MEPKTLGDMLTNRILHKVLPDTSVRKACIIMSSANVGALPVVDENDFILGMVSERDVIKRSVIVYRPSQETPVRQIMTPDPKWLPPEAEVSEALYLMKKGRFRHLPICWHGKLLGIISIRDFELCGAVVPTPAPRRMARLDDRGQAGSL